MERVLDTRGLRCPVPYVKARRELADLADSDALIVLATDPEAPVDIGALAADSRRPCTVAREDGGWRIELGPALPG